MRGGEKTWITLTRAEVIVSLGVFVVTLATSMFETFQIPWTIRIPAALGAAYFALMLWRQLSLRRLLLPTALQKQYEDDLLYVSEAFAGRAIISNVVFRRTELKGPGAIYVEPNCTLLGLTLFNPNIETLVIVPQHNANLLPFFRFRNCIFHDCVFTGVGLLADPNNAHFFGFNPNQQQLPYRPVDLILRQPHRLTPNSHQTQYEEPGRKGTPCDLVGEVPGVILHAQLT